MRTMRTGSTQRGLIDDERLVADFQGPHVSGSTTSGSRHSCAPRWSDYGPPATRSSMPPTTTVAGSSATCTTALSRASPRWHGDRLERVHADGVAATSLSLAQARAQQALERVRAIAHHLYPAALGDAGIAAALDVLPEWRPHLELRELPDGRFPASVEACGYFLVAAVTSSPARAVVSASDAPGRLVVGVRTTRPGDLVEVEDRVGALGGRLTVEPGADGAIQLRTELPCAS